MRRFTRVGLAGLAVVALAWTLGPAATAVDDPRPVDWPVVEKSTESGTTQGDPRPVEPPKVAKPEPGSAEDPKPLQWPVPEPE